MELNEKQLKLLLAFHDAAGKGEPVRYAQFGRDNELPRYEVSRLAKQLAAMELITGTDEDTPAITEKGICEAEAMRKRLESARAHLIYEGVEMQEIERNATVWALSCTNSLFDAIDRIDEHYKTKSLFGSWESFSGYELCRKIGEGYFSLPFIFYKMEPTKLSPHSNISMASDGFYRMCDVLVHNGAGKVVLTPIAMTSDATADGRTVTGKASEFMYWDGTDYAQAHTRNGKITIPMDNFSFINMGGDDIVSRVLHGSIEIKVNCSGGAMPHAMTAMLTVILH